MPRKSAKIRGRNGNVTNRLHFKTPLIFCTSFVFVLLWHKSYVGAAHVQEERIFLKLWWWRERGEKQWTSLTLTFLEQDVLQPVGFFFLTFSIFSTTFFGKLDPHSLPDRDEHSWSRLGVCSLKQLNSSPLRRKCTLLLKKLLICWGASFGEKPGSFCNEKSSSCGTSELSGVWLHTQSNVNTCTSPWTVQTLLRYGHGCGCLHRDPALSHGLSPCLAWVSLKKPHHCKSIYYCKKPSRCEQNLVIRSIKSVTKSKTSIRMAMPLWETSIIWDCPYHHRDYPHCLQHWNPVGQSLCMLKTWGRRVCWSVLLQLLLVPQRVGVESNTGGLSPRWSAWMRRQLSWFQLG